MEQGEEKIDYISNLKLNTDNFVITPSMHFSIRKKILVYIKKSRPKS